MKIIDVAEPSKIDCEPDKIITLIQNGNLVQDEFKIQTVELRSYKQHTDEKLGIFTIITAYVKTDKGSIEILYDEGHRGDDALNESANMLIQNLGLSGLILRSLISLKNQLEKIEK